MNKIEVGEYIRTKNGKIRTIRSIVAQYYITDRLNISDNNQFTGNDIVKNSKNIIDLIEIKDLIKFRNKIQDELENEEMIIEVFNKDTLEDIQNAIEDKEIEIVSIVTKKQFKDMEYRLEV